MHIKSAGRGSFLTQRGRVFALLVSLFFAFFAAACVLSAPTPAHAGSYTVKTAGGACSPGCPEDPGGSYFIDNGGGNTESGYCNHGVEIWGCYVTYTYPDPPPPPASASGYSGTTPFNTPKTFNPSVSNSSGVQVLSQPAHGSAGASGNSLSYTPESGWIGADSFSWRACGDGGCSSAVSASITTQAPPAPTASAYSSSTAYNTAKSFSPSTGGIVTSVSVAGAPGHGSATASGTSITYTPTTGYIGTDTFTFQAVGPGGSSAAQTATITINAPPLPVISGGSLSLAFNASGSVNFNPTNGGVLQVVSGATHGSTSISGGSVTYTPASDYIGSDSFSVKATNPSGESGTQVVNVTVAPPPVPTITGGTVSLAFNQSGSHNFAPTSGGTLTITSAPAHGVATVSGGAVNYTPASDYIGTDSFSATATNLGGTSSPATVNVTVAPPPIPTVTGGSLRLAFNASGEHDFAPTAGGTLAIVAAPAHGSASITGGRVTYSPAEDYIGMDSFTVTATNLGGTSGQATVNVTVDPPPKPVIAGGSLRLAFNQGGSHNFAPTDRGTLTIATPPAHGTATVSGGRVNYEPNEDYIGSDSFAVTATNLGGTSAPASVSVTVDPPPIPVITGGALHLSFNEAGSHNFAPTDRGTLTLSASPAHGTAVINGGLVQYTPDEDYIGADSFAVTATNLGGTSAPASVSVTVDPPPVPVIAGASVSAAFNHPVTYNFTPSDRGVIAIVTQPAHGSATRNGNSVTYTPTQDYMGPDSMTVTATNLGGTSAPVSLNITVVPPDAPVAANATLETAFETPGGVSVTVTGLYNSVAIVAQPQHGVATLSGLSIQYTPTAGYYGPDALTYEATGFGGSSGPATVSITVQRPPAPTASGKTVAVQYGGAADVKLEAAGIHSGFRIVAAPKNGKATLSGDNVHYVADGGFFGADAFSYVSEGPGGDSSTATVSITVAAPDAPVVVAPTTPPTSANGQPVAFALEAKGEYSTFAVKRAPKMGTAAIAGQRATYTPKEGARGEDTFTVVAEGPGGESPPTEFKVVVAGAPLPDPAPTDVTAEVQQGAEVRVEITAGQVGGEYDELVIVEAPAKGQARVEARTFVYGAPADFTGAVELKYAVKASGVVSPTAKLTITVLAMPKVPAKEATASGAEPAMVNLTTGAEGGPFTAAAVVSVSPSSAGSAKILTAEAAQAVLAARAAKSSSDIQRAPAAVEPGDWYLSFEADPKFNGTAKVQYTLTNGLGAKALGELTVQVRNLPDPTRDRGVTALVAAQTQAATRFGSAQVTNVSRRLEALHDERGGRNHLSLSASGAAQPLAERQPGYDPVRERERAALVPHRALLADEADAPAASEATAGGAKVWATGAIQFGRAKGATGRQSFDFTTNGVSAGADLKLTDGLVIGAGGGYGRDVSDLSGDLGKVESQAASIFAYGSFRPVPRLYIDAVAGAASLDFETKREIEATGTEVRGDRRGDQMFGALSVSWDHTRDGLRLAPYGRVEYVRSTLSAFTEKGDDTYSLHFHKQVVEEVSVTSGLRGEYAYRLRNGTLIPSLRGELKKILSDSGIAQVSYAGFADGPTYSIDGTRNGSTAILGGLGLAYRGLNGWDFSLDLDHSSAGSGNGVTTLRVGGAGKF